MHIVEDVAIKLTDDLHEKADEIFYHYIKTPKLMEPLTPEEQ